VGHESSFQDLTLPRGVTVRTHRSGASSIQIAFPYKGHHCREVLKGRRATKTNIRFAADSLRESAARSPKAILST
jgi:hypothetical protein